MTTVDASLRCQILSAWLANETRTTTVRALRVTDDLYREVLADAGFPDRAAVEQPRDRLLSAVVKRELLDRIGEFYDVQAAIDDRQQVVDMWRAAGLLCLQPSPPWPPATLY